MKIATGCLALLATYAVGQSIPPPLGAPSVGDQEAGVSLAPSAKKITAAEAHPVMDISARGPGKLGGLFDPLKRNSRDKDKNPKSKKLDKEVDKKPDRTSSASDKEFMRKKGGSGGGGGRAGKGKSGGGSGSAAAAGPKAPLLFFGVLGFLALPLLLVV